MKLDLKLTKCLLFQLAPLVASSVFVALPGFAATLATSEARVNFTNFSHNPQAVAATANNESYTQAGEGSQVTANAYAEAAFTLNSSASLTQAYGTSVSTVNGDGNDYFGQAQSTSRVQGYNFIVGAGEAFSFEFNGLFGLKASIDYALETANAFGTIAFQVYDNTNADAPVLLDFFTLTGSLNSLSSNDYLEVFKNDNIVFNANETKSFGGNQEVAQSSFTGKISRMFNRVTSLFLVEYKTNSAGASCSSR